VIGKSGPHTINGFNGKAQTTNPCGVVARIWPSAHHSVVPVNTIISFTNVTNNATSVKWLYDGQFNYVFRQAPQILCSLFKIGISFIG